MTKITLTFKKAGLQTLVQDKGRFDYQSFGVPISGVLDKSSAKISNWLVGNALDTPVLEMLLMGSSIVFDQSTQIAITGANLTPKLNNTPISLYETISIQKGDILSFGRVINGCRAYVAVRGIWEIKSWLGSTSASSFKGTVLTPNSIVNKDHILTIKQFSAIEPKVLPKHLRPHYFNSIRVRVIAGPEFAQFSNRAIGFFFSKGYKVLTSSNRMGYRLNGRVFESKNRKSMISSGIVPGTIQVTNSGQPIVLLADAQTTGGYYRLANVISADMDKLAQCKPNDTIWFSLVRLNDAYTALQELQPLDAFLNT